MTHPGKSRHIKTIAVVTAFVLVVMSIGISGSVLAAPESVSSFEADFSGLKNGTILTEDTETVNYLNDRFLFYSFQYYPSSGDGDPQYFERGKVNGYLIDDGENGQIFPDTGAHAAYDMDGYGANADKPIPMWTIDGEWLYSTGYSAADAPLFRTAELMYLRGDTASGFAVLEDFKLETDFMFREDGVQDSLAVYFRAGSAGNAADGSSQSMITFNTNGDLFVGRTPWHNTLQYNDVLKAADGSRVKFDRGHAYHLSMTLQGHALTFTVTDGSKEIAVYTTNSVQISEGSQGGYLALSGSNGGVKYAGITVERYGSDGKVLDFNDLTDGYGFGMNGRAYICARTKYVCKEGGGQAWWEQYYYRMPGATYELDYTKRSGDANSWLGMDSAKTAAADLGARFNVYHDQNVNGVHKFVKAPEFFSHHVGSGISDGYYGAMYIANGGRLLAFLDVIGQGLLKQNMSLVPKTDNGSELVTENFETKFSAILFSDNREQAVSLSFRSQSAGQSLSDDLTGGYADKVTIHFTGTGFAVFDGESSPLSGISYTPWNNGRVLSGAVANIYAKAVGDKLWMRVTNDGGDVLYDNSDAPITLKTGGGGYLYYTANDQRGYFTSIVCRRLDRAGNATDWNGADTVEITKVLTQLEDVTVDRSKGESLNLRTALTGEDKDGNKYPLKVKWSSEEYRSYKEGTFTFTAAPADDSFTFVADAAAKIKVTNVIGGDFDTETSRKYYFDSADDLRDFVCHNSSLDLSKNTEYYDVKMTKVDPLDCWSLLNGSVLSTYSRTFNGGWNGISRASDVSTMVLADDDVALINYKLEIDYKHGSDWWYPYVLYGVQDPAQFFGRVYVSPTQGDKTTGNATDLAFDDQTKRGGVYTYLEVEGNFNFWGAIQGDQYGRVIYDRDITDGQDFIETYDRNATHHMTVTVVNGTVGVQVDDSDVYYAELDDIALGGYVGFGSCGNGVSFSGLKITALDEFGEPMRLADAEKGFAPEPTPDTYTGWLPFETDWAFDWKTPYTFD